MGVGRLHHAGSRSLPLAARLVALFYDWWSIFVRLAEPDRHMEAITSRPLLLHAIATRVRHARQTTITVASSHAKAIPAAKALRAIAIFLRELAKTAEQLTGLQRWRRSSREPSKFSFRAVSCVRPPRRITTITICQSPPCRFISTIPAAWKLRCCAETPARSIISQSISSPSGGCGMAASWPPGRSEGGNAPPRQ